MNEDEEMDCSVQRLKYRERVEVLKAQFESYENCENMALNVDSAIIRVGEGRFYYNQLSFNDNGVVTVEIGNFHIENSRNQKVNRESKTGKTCVILSSKSQMQTLSMLPQVNHVEKDWISLDGFSNSGSAEE